jgi:hypothetical protein
VMDSSGCFSKPVLLWRFPSEAPPPRTTAIAMQADWDRNMTILFRLNEASQIVCLGYQIGG